MDDLSVFHFSGQPGLLEIDPRYIGSRMGSYAGEEKSSISYYDRPDRSGIFAEEMPETVVDPSMRGAFPYEGSVSGVYNAMEDPVVFWAWFDSKIGVTDRKIFLKDFEQSIKDYGYTGYYAPLFNRPGKRCFIQHQ